MAHPWRPPVWVLLVAAVSCRVLQVSPPSVERANRTGSDPAVPRKPDVAHVDVAEVRARFGVVGPELLLVAEQRRVLPGDDDRVHPCCVAACDGARDVVSAGDGDRSGTTEALAAGHVGGDVGVVQALAVRPGEVTVAVGDRSEDQFGITVGDEVVLKVVRKRSDRTIRVRHAAGVGRRRNPGCEVGLPQAARRHPSREPGVRRLRPGPSRVGGELNPRNPHTWRERAGAVVAGVARLQVDVVVGSGGQNRRVDRVDGEPRLVLLVLGEERVVAAHGDLGGAAGRERGGGGQPLDENCRECREGGCGKPVCAHDAP